MKEIRNIDHKLVAKYNPETRSIEIVVRGCKTIITIPPTGEPKISNVRTA